MAKLVDATSTSPSLASQLTIIITTSPIRSNPSLSLLESIIETFHYAGGSDFLSCPRIIVCDGYKKKGVNGGNNKYANEKSQMRSGIVDDDQEANYNQYKSRLKERCDTDHSDPSLLFFNTEILELPTRHGYGFALKAALQRVTTKYVIVIQHDRNFMRPTPIKEVIAAMDQDPAVKYVGILMRSNLMYMEHFVAKYGSPLLENLKACVKRPLELRLDPTKYGGREVAERLFENYPRVTDKYRSLYDNYRSCAPYMEYLGKEVSEVAEGDCGDDDGLKCQASLIPTLFWYDNIHITRTEHYRDWVFDDKRKLVKRGGFVEDKLSPRMVEEVKSKGFVEGWSPYGCYLLDDHCGVTFTGHMDGGAWMTDDMREGRMDNWIAMNRKGPKSETSKSET
mmetsp:Transcript_21293/g.44344  ORF Transcript_21293/g.44344 Transcript_21293/m.44344 type:complete len:395 (-) Transcript_21293:18-1202(-)